MLAVHRLRNFSVECHYRKKSHYRYCGITASFLPSTLLPWIVPSPQLLPRYYRFPLYRVIL